MMQKQINKIQETHKIINADAYILINKLKIRAVKKENWERFCEIADRLNKNFDWFENENISIEQKERTYPKLDNLIQEYSKLIEIFEIKIEG